MCMKMTGFYLLAKMALMRILYIVWFCLNLILVISGALITILVVIFRTIHNALRWITRKVFRISDMLDDYMISLIKPLRQ